MINVCSLLRLTGKMDKKISGYVSVAWVVRCPLRDWIWIPGGLLPSGWDTIPTHAGAPSLLASCCLFLTLSLPGVAVPPLLSSPGRSLDFAHVRAKLCSCSHVAWGGGRVGNGRCCQTQDFTKPQINRLPKYSILDLPLVMFKLNILSLSLQAQLPPGMPAFCDSS